MKAIELNLDLGRSVPISFDLYNPRLPCWNYLCIGGKRDHRNKILSSIVLGDKIKNNTSALVNVCSFGKKDLKLEQLVLFYGGKVLDLSKGYNFLLYPLEWGLMKDKHLSKIKEEIVKNQGPDNDLLDKLDWVTGAFYTQSEEESKNKDIKKFFSFIEPSLWEKTYDNTIPSHEHIDQVAWIISSAIKNYQSNDLFYSIRESVVDFYNKNTQAPTMSLFLEFIKNYNYALFKLISALPETELMVLKNESSIDLSSNGNYFFLDEKNPMSETKALMGFYLLEQQFKTIFDVRRIFIVDNGWDFFKDSFYMAYISLLRRARKMGLTTLFSQKEFLSGDNLSQAFNANIVSVLTFNLESDAKRFSEEFSITNLAGGVNYLKFTLGVKEYGKTNLKYKSEILRDQIAKDPSMVMAEVLKSEDNYEIKQLSQGESSRFLDWQAISGDKKDLKGIWSVKVRDLTPNDLVFLDQELGRKKLKEGVVVLDQEIGDDVLYSDYNFKKVKNKITFIHIEDLLLKLDKMSDQEKLKLTTLKSPPANAKILYVDIHEAGLIDLEV